MTVHILQFQMEFTWILFQKWCLELLEISNEIGDEWKWIDVHPESEFNGYLNKKVRSLMSTKKNGQRIVTFDYHCLYSPSYGVPVLYFNVYNSSNLIKHDLNYC